MAVSMDALLKIKADVSGEGAVQNLARGIGNLNRQAGDASKGFRGLLGAAGGVSGALSALIPLASGAGLSMMAKNAIDAADNMRDLAQKTGVTVEQLSRFQGAAKQSGTDIEAVGAAMIKLNKNLATNNDDAAAALKQLGISATDANGKLKSADQVMLEVADKFAKMEDGANKSAAAQMLFGKAGANLIPLLNGGRSAVESMATTMSTKFAESADRLNDKLATLQGKLLQVAVGIGTALMPVLDAVTNAVIGIASAFEALPGPLQTIIGSVAALAAAFVVLAPAISSVISIAAALSSLQLGATIAGWLGAVGPAIAGITAAFTGLLAWIGGTLIPGLLAFFSGPVGWTILAIAAVVAMCIAFREPIGKFLVWFGEAFMQGIEAVVGFLKLLFVDPWIGLWNNVLRAPVTAMWSWLQEAASWALGALYAIAWQLWVQPWINLWNTVLRQPVTAAFGWLQSTWKQVSSFFLNGVVKPISSAWTALMTTISNAMRTAAGAVTSVWNTVLGTVKNVIRSFLQGWANAINSVIAQVNRLIQTFNLLPGPDIGTLGTVSVPAFAQGGVVTRPTVGLVGEAGPEYIIPASKMAAASQRFLGGARGDAVLNGRAASAAPAQINITTGPVVEMNGQRYVSLSDLELAMRITADSVMGQLRTPSARIALGLA
jgi:phage-related protein